MSSDRPPTDETTARLVPPPPPRSNVVFARGTEEVEVTVDGQWIPREREFIKVYPDLAREVRKTVGVPEFDTLLFISRFAKNEGGRLVIQKTAAELADEVGKHRSTVLAHLKELQAHGYVAWEQERLGKGSFSKGRWVVHWTSGIDRFNVNVAPVAPDRGDTENPRISPQSGYPTSVSPDRSQANPTPVGTTSISPQSDIPTPVSGLRPPEPAATGAGESRLRLDGDEPNLAESAPWPRSQEQPTPAVTGPGELRLQTEEGVDDEKSRRDINNSDALQPLEQLAVQGLRANGVSPRKIEELLTEPGAEECVRQLAAINYRIEAAERTGAPIRSRAGYLIRAIEETWSDPPEIVERQQALEQERLRQAEEAAEIAEEALRLERERQLDEALARLDPDEAKALEAEIVAKLTDPQGMYARLFQFDPSVLELIKRQELRERLLGGEPEERAA